MTEGLNGMQATPRRRGERGVTFRIGGREKFVPYRTLVLSILGIAGASTAVVVACDRFFPHPTEPPPAPTPITTPDITHKPPIDIVVPKLNPDTPTPPAPPTATPTPYAVPTGETDGAGGEPTKQATGGPPEEPTYKPTQAPTAAPTEDATTTTPSRPPRQPTVSPTEMPPTPTPYPPVEVQTSIIDTYHLAVEAAKQLGYPEDAAPGMAIRYLQYKELGLGAALNSGRALEMEFQILEKPGSPRYHAKTAEDIQILADIIKQSPSGQYITVFVFPKPGGGGGTGTREGAPAQEASTPRNDQQESGFIAVYEGGKLVQLGNGYYGDRETSFPNGDLDFPAEGPVFVIRESDDGNAEDRDIADARVFYSQIQAKIDNEQAKADLGPASSLHVGPIPKTTLAPGQPLIDKDSLARVIGNGTTGKSSGMTMADATAGLRQPKGPKPPRGGSKPA